MKLFKTFFLLTENKAKYLKSIILCLENLKNNERTTLQISPYKINENWRSDGKKFSTPFRQRGKCI